MRKFLLISVLALGFLYSWATWADVHAAETFVTVDKLRDIKTYRVLYRETTQFVVDEYQQVGTNFQQRVSQKKFSSELEARNILAQFVKEFMEAKGNKDELPITELDGEVLWIADKEWSAEWERAYAEWITKKVDANFHKRFGIATDCADVAISLRWIFARINKLPMASSMAGSRRLFTNETVLRSWVNLPTAENWYDDRRFFAALNYILDNTYTHSLLEDSYPIAIATDFFMAGVHHLDLYHEDTGHTRFVGWLDPELGEIGLFASTTPRDLRTLSTDSLQDTEGVENFSSGGFLKIRWAEHRNGLWVLRSRDQMPGYSMEQYAHEYVDRDVIFFRKILEKLGFQYDPVLQMKNVIDAIKSRLETRVQIVQDGYQFCQANPCAPGTSGYESWSTPHRDLAIANLAVFLYDIGYENQEAKNLLTEFVLSSWRVEGHDVIIEDLLLSFYYNHISSDPRDPPRTRWGFDEQL